MHNNTDNICNEPKMKLLPTVSQLILVFCAFIPSTRFNYGVVEAKVDVSRPLATGSRRTSSSIRKERLRNGIGVHHNEKIDKHVDVLNNHPKTSKSFISRVRGGQKGTSTLSSALLGAVVMAVIEKLVKEGLNQAKIKFPAGLGACIILFTTLILLDFINPALSSYMFQSLTPGSALLAKWLPVMFVPGLVMLPLSPPIGTTIDVSIKGLE
jgi:hypothetical protein